MNSYNFKNIYLITFVLVLGMTLIHFYRNVTSPTDENLFQAIKSTFYTTQILPIYNDSIKIDSIPAGVIITKINKKQIKNYNDLNEFLNVNSLSLELEYLQPNNNRLLTKTIKSQNLSLDKIFFINSGVQIFEITTDGASDRAGLKIGDIILKINGKPFKDIMEADMMMKRYSINRLLTYTILRGDSISNIKVKLANYGINFFFLFTMLTSLLTIFIAGYIAFSRPKLFTARITAFALIALGFQFANNFANYTFEFDIIAYIQILLVLVFNLLGLPLFFHSLLYFPREQTEVLKQQWIIKIPYLIGAMLLSSMIFVVFYLRGKYLIYVNYSVLLIYIFTPFYYLAIRIIYRKKYHPEQTRISRAILIALNLVLLVVLPSQIWRMLLPLGYDRYLTMIFISIPLAYIYTIKKYNLLDLNFKPTKGTIYLITQISMNFLVFITFVLGFSFFSKFDIVFPNLHFSGSYIEVLDHPMPRELHRIYNEFFIVVLCLMWAFLLLKIRVLVLSKIDNLFSRVKFDLISTSSQLTEMFKRELNEDDLCKSIACKLGAELKLKSLGVVLFKQDHQIWGQSFYNLMNKNILEFHLKFAKSIFYTMNQFKGAINIEYLPDFIKHEYFNSKFNLLIPIKTNESCLGYLLIGEKEAETAFDAQQIEVLSSIASQIAVAVENVFLYQELAVRERMKHELELARTIQLNTLPQETPLINGLDIAGISIPAYEVGGDFYDYLTKDNNSLTLIIGDVSGKGTSAALYMSQVQGIFRTLNEFNLTPKNLLSFTNTNFRTNINKSYFLTAIAAKFDSEKSQLLIARAGHLPVLHFHSDNSEISKILPKGMGIGMCDKIIFDKNSEEEKIKFYPGDVFVFLSDGLSESRNTKSDDYGLDRVSEVIKNHSHKEAFEIRDVLIEDVNQFSRGTEQFDDMTLVVVKIKIQS